jgi:hypothetical protein
MTTVFTQLNLHPQLVQAVEALGFTTPTPIQSALIPVMMAGHDVIGQAQTGTRQDRRVCPAYPQRAGGRPGRRAEPGARTHA